MATVADGIFDAKQFILQISTVVNVLRHVAAAWKARSASGAFEDPGRTEAAFSSCKKEAQEQLRDYALDILLFQARPSAKAKAMLRGAADERELLVQAIYYTWSECSSAPSRYNVAWNRLEAAADHAERWLQNVNPSIKKGCGGKPRGAPIGDFTGKRISFMRDHGDEYKTLADAAEGYKKTNPADLKASADAMRYALEKSKKAK